MKEVVLCSSLLRIFLPVKCTVCTIVRIISDCALLRGKLKAMIFTYPQDSASWYRMLHLLTHGSHVY